MMNLHWFKKITLMFAVALLLASATVSMGFPSEFWSSNGKSQGERGKNYQPIAADIKWILPEQLSLGNSPFDGKAIALVFSGVAFSPNDPAPEVTLSPSGTGLVSDMPRTPVLMDIALLNSTYFTPDRTGFASVEFCVFPQDNSTTRYIYADLYPNTATAGLWDSYVPQSPAYDPGILPNNHPTKQHNYNLELGGANDNIGILTTTAQITDFPLYFWFTVLIFDEDTVDGSSSYQAYDMLFQFNADAGTGNALSNIRLEFRDFYNIEHIPEPATALLALAGIGLLLAQKRKRK